MNSVPARQRGAASGMLATFQNSGFVLSIGIFFSLMIAGLASHPADHADQGPDRAGRAARDRAPDRPDCRRSAACSPPSSATTRSAAARARPACSATCRPHNVAALTGKQFFPHLISRAVPRRPGHRVQHGDKRAVDRGGRVAAARRQVRVRGRRPWSGRRGTGEDGGREHRDRGGEHRGGEHRHRGREHRGGEHLAGNTWRGTPWRRTRAGSPTRRLVSPRTWPSRWPPRSPTKPPATPAANSPPLGAPPGPPVPSAPPPESTAPPVTMIMVTAEALHVRGALDRGILSVSVHLLREESAADIGASTQAPGAAAGASRGGAASAAEAACGLPRLAT